MPEYYAGFCKRQIVDIDSCEVLACAGQFVDIPTRNRVQWYHDYCADRAERAFDKWREAGDLGYLQESRTYARQAARVEAALISRLFVQ